MFMGEKSQNHQCATSVCSTEEFPMEWERRQFPVRTCFAMTINKSKGQSLERVGVWLEESVFSQGQLYVACSRVGDPSNIKFAIKKHYPVQHLTYYIRITNRYKRRQRISLKRIKIDVYYT